MGGPSYSPDFGLVIGGSALFTFRMDKSDLEVPRSVVPLAIAFMTKGGVKVVSKPQLFFAHDRFRIFGQFQYENFPDNFGCAGERLQRCIFRLQGGCEQRLHGQERGIQSFRAHRYGLQAVSERGEPKDSGLDGAVAQCVRYRSSQQILSIRLAVRPERLLLGAVS